MFRQYIDNKQNKVIKLQLLLRKVVNAHHDKDRLQKSQLAASQLNSSLSQSKVLRSGRHAQKTPLHVSANVSLKALLRSHQPFTQYPNFERLYHAVSLNSTLLEIIQNPEFTCCVLACIRQLPLEQKRAPRSNYRKFGIILFNLLGMCLTKEDFKNQQQLYPLSTRALMQEKRLPATLEAACNVLDTGMLLCRDMRLSQICAPMGQVLGEFYRAKLAQSRLESCKGQIGRYMGGLSDAGRERALAAWCWSE
ncbi:hypothetical protein SS50377_24859 [Spironucleus salmonicida]|nr:hypothetical protein SS50377_24859 [Spironucleus salmonicida]|eukprot:EST49105.1 Hypothetical protein SS50377_10586 [Spironucleus salmonicida]